MSRKNETPSQTSQFSLLNILLVLGVAALLYILFKPSISSPGYPNSQSRSVNRVKNIVLGLRTYSYDNDGYFPKSQNGKPFTSSQDAFNLLIPDIINTESTFWIETSEPNHHNHPVEDDHLDKGECTYGYISGQHDTDTYALSPLVFEGFLNKADFSCSEYMPWLEKKVAVVGFADGHVEQARLTSKKPGATIKSSDGKVDNIFLERTKGGHLDTSSNNALFPMGWN